MVVEVFDRGGEDHVRLDAAILLLVFGAMTGLLVRASPGRRVPGVQQHRPTEYSIFCCRPQYSSNSDPLWSNSQPSAVC